jgi:glycosyltransferase 2 family protein
MRIPISTPLRTRIEAARLVQFLLLTAIIWSLDVAVALGTARALGLSMSLPAAFLLLTGLGLGSALPSTPGYVGVYQFVAVSLLLPYGFSRNDAIAFILLLQAMTYAAVLSWGRVGLFLFRHLMRIHDAWSEASG